MSADWFNVLAEYWSQKLQFELLQRSELSTLRQFDHFLAAGDRLTRLEVQKCMKQHSETVFGALRLIQRQQLIK